MAGPQGPCPRGSLSWGTLTRKSGSAVGASSILAQLRSLRGLWVPRDPPTPHPALGLRRAPGAFLSTVFGAGGGTNPEPSWAVGPPGWHPPPCQSLPPTLLWGSDTPQSGGNPPASPVTAQPQSSPGTLGPHQSSTGTLGPIRTPQRHWDPISTPCSATSPPCPPSLGCQGMGPPPALLPAHPLLPAPPALAGQAAAGVPGWRCCAAAPGQDRGDLSCLTDGRLQQFLGKGWESPHHLPGVTGDPQTPPQGRGHARA